MFAAAISSQQIALSRKPAGSESTKSKSDASDAALITAVAAGDRCAMQVLYTRHSVRVFRFILRMINNPSLAEDLVSEVFLDVWRNARSFKAKSQVSTWLLAIARNKAFSALRRRSGRHGQDTRVLRAKPYGEIPQISRGRSTLAAIGWGSRLDQGGWQGHHRA